ncbi:MAG: YdcF family protein [Burkholderiales bacterium]
MKSTCCRILLWLALATALVAVAVAFGAARAGYWLEAPMQAPRRADAIVVLGGDEGDRALRALGLYREGYAPTVVLTGLEYGDAAPPAALTWRADFLEARGVPRSALRFEVDSKNSYTEAVNVLALMRQQGWRTVIVVSDPPHMRRLSWTWGRVFADSGLEYVLVASRPDWWSPGDWWREERSGGFVIMEFIKLGYYVAKR